MATQSKFIFNPAYFEKLCPILKRCVQGFDCNDFIFRIFNNDWPDEDLRERVRHISRVLNHFLPDNFPEAADRLVQIARDLRMHYPSQAIENMFLADYVEVFGLDHPDISLRTLEEITRSASAESAVRAFIIRYPDKTMQYLVRWSFSDNADVRRLAAEGLKTLSAHAMIDMIMV
jgi:hypothetical protein